MTAPDPIDALEIRIAHQDRTIEDLDRSVTEQWQVIDALTRKVAWLETRLAEAEAILSASPEKPLPRD